MSLKNGKNVFFEPNVIYCLSDTQNQYELKNEKYSQTVLKVLIKGFRKEDRLLTDSDMHRLSGFVRICKKKHLNS